MMKASLKVLVAFTMSTGCSVGHLPKIAESAATSHLVGGWIGEDIEIRRGWLDGKAIENPSGLAGAIYIRSDGTLDMSRTMWQLAGNTQHLRFVGDAIDNGYYRYKVVWCEYTPERSGILVGVSNDQESSFTLVQVRASDDGTLQYCDRLCRGPGEAAGHAAECYEDCVIRRLYRIPPGNCQSCAFPLAGNTSGICPECGTTIPDGVKEQPTTDPPKQ